MVIMLRRTTVSAKTCGRICMRSWDGIISWQFLTKIEVLFVQQHNNILFALIDQVVLSTSVHNVQRMTRIWREVRSTACHWSQIFVPTSIPKFMMMFTVLYYLSEFFVTVPFRSFHKRGSHHHYSQRQHGPSLPFLKWRISMYIDLE